jgi:hypothetical protein
LPLSRGPSRFGRAGGGTCAGRHELDGRRAQTCTVLGHILARTKRACTAPRCRRLLDTGVRGNDRKEQMPDLAELAQFRDILHETGIPKHNTGQNETIGRRSSPAQNSGQIVLLVAANLRRNVPGTAPCQLGSEKAPRSELTQASQSGYEECGRLQDALRRRIRRRQLARSGRRKARAAF